MAPGTDSMNAAAASRRRSDSIDAAAVSRRRTNIYIGLFVLLFFGYFLLRGISWQGTKHLHSIMEVIAAADSALYASKEGGRNHISLASS